MSSPEKPRPTSDQRRLYLDLYHILERRDPHIAENRTQRRAAITQYRANETAIQERQFADIQALPLERYLPELQRYPLRVSRHGHLFTNDFKQHYYLPRRRDVPNALAVTTGDLHAAAQWDVLPQITNLDSLPPQQLEQTHRLLNELELRTLLRHFYIEKHLYDDQLLKTTERYAMAHHRRDIAAFMEQADAGKFNAQSVDQAAIADYLTRPSVLAERVAASLLSRVGSHIRPSFKVFSPRAGTDRFKKVDLLAQIQASGAEPWLMGIDITTATQAEVLWEKHLKMIQDQRPQHTTDLVSGQRYLLKRDNAVWPAADFSPHFCYDRWQKQHQQSLATPEYYMRTKDRAAFVENMLRHFVTPENEPLYEPIAIMAAYQAVYGQYDQRNPSTPR